MILHEPATFITDLILSVLGFFFAHRLRGGGETSDARRWWICSMLLMAVSALAGGFYHGFAPELPPAIEAVWWRIVLWIICGLGFAMGVSLLCELRPRGGRRAWMILLGVKLAISAGIVAFKPEFVVAMADYASAMLAWLVAAFMVRRPWSRSMVAGVVLSFLAGAVQQLRWGFGAGFNHNDVFHVIQALALLCFYRAGRQMMDTDG